MTAMVSRNAVFASVTMFTLCGTAAAQTATQPAPPVAGPDQPPSAATQPTASEPAPVAAKRPEELDPFAYADWTWLSGNPRTKDSKLGNEYVTGEFRLDDVFHYSFNHPKDDTINGSTEAWRHGENQVTQLGIGGDFHVGNAQGRLMTQFGQISTTTPRNDASPGRGQWQLADMYRYLAEAYGGYHFGDPHRGVNVQAGIFMSYIGLWSAYNFDNWTYQPSFVSSNTPWFFNGVRAQWFPTDRLKIEPWLINGWQSYGRFNTLPGFGGQILWRPDPNLSIVGNQYVGTDTLNNPDRKRIHSDDSIQYRWYEDPNGSPITRFATTLTVDAGCEYGGGVSCSGGNAAAPSQYFLGFMTYARAWFGEHYAMTLGGGAMTNPGRYLVLMPSINGATALSGTSYFTTNPGDKFWGADGQLTLDYMPDQYVTFRAEFTYRYASVPYWAGPGGSTPPGGNQGASGSMVPGWAPDMVRSEPRLSLALLVKL